MEIRAWIERRGSAKDLASHFIVWLCPEEQHSWGFGDSEMHTYSQHVHQTVVVQSVADLDKVAEQIVPA